jgi:hypothetical protein
MSSSTVVEPEKEEMVTISKKEYERLVSVEKDLEKYLKVKSLEDICQLCGHYYALTGMKVCRECCVFGRY